MKKNRWQSMDLGIESKSVKSNVSNCYINRSFLEDQKSSIEGPKFAVVDEISILFTFEAKLEGIVSYHTLVFVSC